MVFFQNFFNLEGTTGRYDLTIIIPSFDDVVAVILNFY